MKNLSPPPTTDLDAFRKKMALRGEHRTEKVAHEEQRQEAIRTIENLVQLLGAAEAEATRLKKRMLRVVAWSSLAVAAAVIAAAIVTAVA